MPSRSSSSTDEADAEPTLLEVGRIAKPHGVQGEVTVALLSNRPERLTPGSELYAEGRPLTVSAVRPHHDRHLVRFEGVDSRGQADALRGLVLYGEPLHDPDVLWVHELIGAAVVDTNGDELGTVAAVVANPASDLLELESGALIPLTFLVDHDEDTVVVDPPAGLLELP